MTGYRIDYAVGPAKLMKQVGKAHQSMLATAPGPMMAGALEACVTVVKILSRCVLFMKSVVIWF